MNPVKVVAAGKIKANLILCGDVTPAFGPVEELVGDARFVNDGSTAMFTCGAGAARLRLRTAIGGKVGNDIFGRFMIGAPNQPGAQAYVEARMR
jgi:hypothetical protein